MKKFEKMAAKAVNSIIDIETYGWPPVCFGVFYQPERPQVKPLHDIYIEKQPNLTKGENDSYSSLV